MAGAGARLVLATHANRFRDLQPAFERQQLLAWRLNYPRAEEHVLLEMERRANEAVRQAASASGAALADVASAVQPEPANFADFVHFTDAGSARAARAFADAISAAPGRTASAAPRPTSAGPHPRPGF